VVQTRWSVAITVIEYAGAKREPMLRAMFFPAIDIAPAKMKSRQQRFRQ